MKAVLVLLNGDAMVDGHSRGEYEIAFTHDRVNDVLVERKVPMVFRKVSVDPLVYVEVRT